MDSSTLANKLTAYDANKQNSVDVLNNAMSQYGVPEIRSRVSGLRTTLTNTENALNNVDPSVTGRTQGSLVTEAQRQAQVNNERAPIAQQYSDQQGALSNESSNLTDAENSANQLATSKQNDYAAGRQALQDEYTTAYTREQDAANMAEKVREASLAASANSAANSGFSLGTSSSAPVAKVAQLQQRADKGFNFQDASGKAISAAQYAQISNTPFRTLLQHMADDGDVGAKTALNYVGNDFGYNAPKIAGNTNISNLLNSLLWGVNSVKAASTAKSSSKVQTPTISPVQSMQNNAARGLGILKK